MTFFKRNWLLTLFVIAVLGISGYFFFQSQKGPDVNDIPIVKPKPPAGKTAQGGHFHDDGTWHDAPHPTPLETPQDPVDISVLVQTPKSIWKQAYQKARAKAKAEGRYLTADDIVVDAVPSEAELQAMSDEELGKLYIDSTKKMKSLFPEVNKHSSALVDFRSELFRDAKNLEERERIYKENRDKIDPLREARDAINYEFYVHSVTASRVSVEQQRRSPPSTFYHVDPETLREVKKRVEETDIMDIYRQIEKDILEGGKE